MVLSGIGGDGKAQGRNKQGHKRDDRLGSIELENARACVVLGRLLETFEGDKRIGLG